MWSKRVRYGMVAVAVAAGILGARANMARNSTQEYASEAVAGLAVAGSIAEGMAARRRARQVILDFHDTKGEFAKASSEETIPLGSRILTAGTGVAGVGLGWAACRVLTNAATSEALTTVSQRVPGYMVGGVMAATTGLLMAVDTLRMNGTANTYAQQIDAIADVKAN